MNFSFQSDSVSYFLDELDRIARLDYKPSQKDILLCRKATKGVYEFTIRIQVRKTDFSFVLLHFLSLQGIVNFSFFTLPSEFCYAIFLAEKKENVLSLNFIIHVLFGNPFCYFKMVFLHDLLRWFLENNRCSPLILSVYQFFFANFLIN